MPDRALGATQFTEMRHKKRATITIVLSVSILCTFISLTCICIDLFTRGQGKAFYASLPVNYAIGPTDVHLDVEENEEEDETQDVFIPSIDFDALRLECPDAAAWIRIDDTIVNYAVMQGTDNEYYLEHLPNKTKNRIGSIFLDYRNSPDFSDPMTLIYGHYTKSGEMFGSLKEYKQGSYYSDHPIVSIFTPEKDFEVELFAGFIIDSAVEIPPMMFLTDEDFENYIEDIRSRSVFQSDVEVELGDRLVCLCTCDYDIKNGRLILAGRLAEP